MSVMPALSNELRPKTLWKKFTTAVVSSNVLLADASDDEPGVSIGVPGRAVPCPQSNTRTEGGVTAATALTAVGRTARARGANFAVAARALRQFCSTFAASAKY